MIFSTVKEIRMEAITFESLMEHMELKNAVPEVDISGFVLTVPEINRPALQLTGFYEHFSKNRVQVIGNVEYTYLNTITPEERAYAFESFISKGIPCVIFTNGNEPHDVLKKLAIKYNVPVLISNKKTSAFTAEIIRWMRVELAPNISIHGVMVDVYGEGVLITGESGIGKSEAALELIRRGHRLVSDDVVKISRISDEMLIGEAPAITKHFIELRGIGIIDIKSLFGIECVEDSHAIDLVIKLVEWDKDLQYDRLGLNVEYEEFLGKKVVCHTIPVRPGRNLAVIVETAAVNHRQKKMGYNAAEELYSRVTENIAKRRNKE